MTETKTENIREVLNTRLREIERTIKRQQYTILLFWTVIIIIGTITIFMLGKPHGGSMRGLIMSLLYAIVLVNWFINIPFILIMAIILIRTRSRNYLSQFVPQLGLQVMITIVAFTDFIHLKEEDPLMGLYILFLLIIIILELTSLVFYMRSILKNKKPIFFWTFFQDSLEAYSSSLLSQQASLINEQNDGYSQRPFFTSIREVQENIPDNEELSVKLDAYLQFLLDRSEIIGWDIEKESIIFYPRVLLGNMKKGLGIWYLWNLLRKISQKEGLTKITIDLNTSEMSLMIAQDDYLLLNDVTYHVLGQQILERFKQSIDAFLKDDPKKAYSILFPLG